MAERRIVVAERSGGGLRTLSRHAVSVGDVVTVGREGSLVLGADPPDVRVSRVALRVECHETGWSLGCVNRNGVLVQPWGLPGWQARDVESVTDSRVGMRVLGSPPREHWVLLEDDTRAGFDPGDEPTGNPTMLTERSAQARPLTPAQMQAVYLVFGDLLCWPPTSTGQPHQLKQVARALGVSVSAVQERLKAVLGKARSLGFEREVELTDPEYVYVLVRAGYLRPEHVHASL